jgi:hypothetical protein
MSKPTPWTKRFEASCRKWHVKLGLTDWTIRYAVEKASDTNEAEVAYNCDSRHAKITAYASAGEALSPERVALHEMLHLLFADVIEVAAQRGSSHADVAREEHRLIERLLNAFDGRL